MTPPRSVVDWNEYFMQLAKHVATKSKDPNTQHGAVIVGQDKTIVSTGYNGPPQWIDDTKMDWGRPQKYPLIRHAEQNAMQWSSRAFLDNCVLFVTGVPCSMCYLEMVSKRIHAVVYGNVESSMCDGDNWEKLWMINRSCSGPSTFIIPFGGDKMDLVWDFSWRPARRV